MQGQGNMTLKAFAGGVRQAGRNVGRLEELGLQPSKERESWPHDTQVREQPN